MFRKIRKKSSFPPPQRSYLSSIMAGGVGGPISDEQALRLGAVWGCVGLVSGTLSSLPLSVYKTKDSFKVEAVNHPIYRILRYAPNFEQTPVDFLDAMISSLELYGNSFARIDRLDGRIISLYNIQPRFMSVSRNNGGEIKYRWSENGISFEGTRNEILHIRGAGGDALGGVSTLQMADKAIRSATATADVAERVSQNNLRTPVVLSFGSSWLTKDQRDIVTSGLKDYQGSAAKSGSPLVMPGDVKVQQLSVSPLDAQLLEMRRFSIDDICRFFQVPPALIGHGVASSSWPTSFEQQVLMFQKFCLRRRIKRIEQSLDKHLLSPSERGRGYKIRFSLDGLLRGDPSARTKYYQTMTQIGAMTINEVRMKEGLSPLEGGDVVRMQQQYVPISENDGGLNE